MPWVALGVFAAFTALGYFVFEKMKAAPSSGGSHGIPPSGAGVMTHMTIAEGDPAGSIGQAALGPNDSLVIDAYDPSATGAVWLFTTTGPLQVAPSGNSATFTWNGGQGSAVAVAVLHKPVPSGGMALPPIATYTVQVNPAVY